SIASWSLRSREKSAGWLPPQGGDWIADFSLDEHARPVALLRHELVVELGWLRGEGPLLGPLQAAQPLDTADPEDTGKYVIREKLDAAAETRRIEIFELKSAEPVGRPLILSTAAARKARRVVGAAVAGVIAERGSWRPGPGEVE